MSERSDGAVKALISTLARVVLGAVLIVAGALKVSDPETSVQAVKAYELLPSSLETAVGWGLPFLEIGLGLLLVIGYGTRYAAVVSGLLMAVFIAGVASAWSRGLAIDCGCFGGGGQVAPGDTAYLQEILRDVGLLALAGWLVLFPRSKWSLETDPHASAVPTETGAKTW